MFLGLYNFLAIFQKYINKVLAKKSNIFVIIYFDNILIYVKDYKKDNIDTIS